MLPYMEVQAEEAFSGFHPATSDISCHRDGCVIMSNCLERI